MDKLIFDIIKPLIIILIILSFCGVANGQDYEHIKQFINQVHANNQLLINGEAMWGEQIAYQDSTRSTQAFIRKALNSKKVAAYKFSEDSIIYIDDAGVKKRISVAQARAFKQWPKTERIKTDSLVLSAAEQDYVNGQINQMYSFKWKPNLLPNLNLIPTDTLTKLYAEKKDKAWDHLDKRHINYIYTFSKPIFLRDDSYCLFYYSYNCKHRNCGAGELSFFKKVSGKWLYWARISFWMS